MNSLILYYFNYYNRQNNLHFFFHFSGPVNFVRLGVTDFDSRVSKNFEFSQQFTISEKIRHPDYKPNSKYYDIGLLKLHKP